MNPLLLPSVGMERSALIFSELLTKAGVPHAFTTRVGGTSAPPFDSLNFGNPMDLPAEIARDPVANISANFRCLAEDIGAEGREVVQVYQVHGNAAKVLRRGDPSRERRPALPHEPRDDEFDFKADAIVTDDPARLAAVRVADCTPILLASEDGRIVSAVHAGWRGVVGGVVKSAVAAMVQVANQRGERMQPRDLIAAIGPCIGVCAFEVGPEVVAQFASEFGAGRHVVEHHDGSARAEGKAFIDLKAALHGQVAGLGLESVDVIEGCTASDPRRFFSHRRERGVTGRMVGVIGPRG